MRRTVLTLAFLVIPLAGRASAQDSPAPVVEFSVGWVGFADDGIVGEGLVGGAARIYVSPRISVGPEIAYIRGTNHSHLMLTGNVNFELLPSGNPASHRITLFAVVGGGLFQTHEQFFTGPFTSSEGAFTAGGGVRALVGDRVMLGADVRFGWELHVRVSGTLGVRLGR